jgi:hypothetical protein
MNDIPKGGRGHKAVYETTHMRVPLPLKQLFTKLMNQYKIYHTVNGDEYDLTPEVKYTREQAIEQAKQILKQKKGAKVSLEKLLTALYGVDVTLD